MGRKNLLQDLISPTSMHPSVQSDLRKPTQKAVGLVSAMTESIETMATDLRKARHEIETGSLIVEIPTDLIDPSFITDRIGDDDEMEAFVASIQEHGQHTPVLLRPHPKNPGRYQIAFGHRRYRALRKLGLPVKAVVKELSDSDLVVAQGQENRSRLDLSYIERAVFAARLETRGFQREVICSSLSVDKSEVSRMINVASALPEQLIEVIGPAQKTGRRKWLELAKVISTANWPSEKEMIVKLLRSRPTANSDKRFELVLRHLGDLRPAQKGENATKLPTFKVDRKPGMIRIRFDERQISGGAVDELISQVCSVCERASSMAVSVKTS